ncbi:MAG TPA: GNAT family N-acetyltransferase, partial [Ktedonobacteraceae bacterium]
RGLGYGREILEQLIHIAREASHKPVMLDVETDNTNAVGLYLSCGFEIKTTYDYYELRVESVG